MRKTTESDNISVSSSVEEGNQKNTPVSAVQQLFARLTQEIDEKNPTNVIFFMVDFLCKHYPHHLNGFASIWNGDPELEKERIQVIQFFRFQKIPVEIAADFTNVGFDTLETLCTITPEALDNIETLSEAKWLPGHRVRLQQTFSDICNRVRAFRQEKEKLFHLSRLSKGHCDHSTVITRTNVPRPKLPPCPTGHNPLPRFDYVHEDPKTYTVHPPCLTGVPNPCLTGVPNPRSSNNLPFLTASFN